MKWPADRITQSSAKSFGMYEKAAKLAAGGEDIIHLEVGRPNFDTPQHIKDATKAALDAGKVHYGQFLGEHHFRKALAQKLKTYNGIEAQVDEIIVTAGLTHGAYAACMAGIDPGDEVILLEPYYPQHVNKVELAGGKIVTVPLNKKHNFSIDASAIEAAITAKTRMIALVNPANPTGRVYSRAELEALAQIAIDHDLLVMSDEVYEQILFDGHQHLSIAALPGMRQRTISLFAFTKGYAMDGWRMGYAVADQSLIGALSKITVNDLAHVNVFIQEGGYAAITGSQACVEQMVAEDKRRRDMVCARLNAMPNVSCPIPQATIYAFPNIEETGLSAQQIADQLLAETGVVVEAGTFYGANGAGHLRVCFGAEDYERIAQAMDRMDVFFHALAKKQ